MHPLIIEILSTVCRCTRVKRKMNTFCSRCYYKLPQAMRSALYQKIGEGYEESYKSAVAFLDGDGSMNG